MVQMVDFLLKNFSAFVSISGHIAGIGTVSVYLKYFETINGYSIYDLRLII